MQKILFVLAISLFSSWSVFSQNVEETYQFAEEQLKLGNYNNSLLAFERAIFFEDHTSADTYTKLADVYFAAGNQERAIRFYDIAYFSENDPDLKNEIIFKKSLAYLQLENYDQALISLTSINSFQNKAVAQKKTFYKTLTYYLKGDFASYHEQLSQYTADQNIEGKDEFLLHNKWEKKAAKIKPNLAMWMSVVLPGSGQILYGDWQNGLNSLALTTGLIALYINYIDQFSLIEAYLVVFPWFERYHKGGYLRAKENAEEKIDLYRSKAYQSLLKLHPAMLK